MMKLEKILQDINRKCKELDKKTTKPNQGKILVMRPNLKQAVSKQAIIARNEAK